MARTEKNDRKNTHHLGLNDGTNAVMSLILSDASGRPNPRSVSLTPVATAGLQTFSGSQGYGDTPPPWSPLILDNWAMGMGYETHFLNPDGYADAFMINAEKENKLIQGGDTIYTEGSSQFSQFWPRHSGGAQLSETNVDLDHNTYSGTATQFTAPMDMTPEKVTILCELTWPGTDTAVTTVTVGVYDNDSNVPGSVVRAGEFEIARKTNALGGYADSDIVSGIPLEITVDLDTGAGTLTSGTVYWVGITLDQTTDGELKVYGVSDLHPSHGDAPNNSTYVSGTWGTGGDVSAFYRLFGSADHCSTHFFEYYGVMFRANSYMDGGASRLFINGDLGLCSATTSTTTTVQGLNTSWAADEAIGCLITIVAGTGSDQRQPSRLITDSAATDTDVTTFTHAAWDIDPDTNSFISVVAHDKWNEIDVTADPPNWDAPKIITDVLVANGVVYFCHGDSTAMTSMKVYDNAGVFTVDWQDETGQFFHLINAADQNGSFLVGATGGRPSTYSICGTIEDGTSLTATHSALSFDTAISNWDVGEKTTNLLTYGEYGNVWALKEGRPYQMIDRKFYEVNIPEMAGVRDARNGSAYLQHGVYLYFVWHKTILRYLQNNLDSIGPDKTEVGLPTDRMCDIEALAGYPGKVIAAFSAGTDTNLTSHVMVHNGSGWSEIYRSPIPGIPIMDIKVQSIPYDHVDRLWIALSDHALWVPLSVNPVRHPDVQYNFYPFRLGAGYLQTGWIYNNRLLTKKLFKNIVLDYDNTGAEVFYRLDDDTSWKGVIETKVGYWEAPDGFNSPAAYNTVGRRIQFKVYIYTNANKTTPSFKALLMRALVNEEGGDRANVYVLISDEATTLRGRQQVEYQSASTALAQIEDWSEQPIALQTTSEIEELDGRWVILKKGEKRVLRTRGGTKYLQHLVLEILE